MTQNYPKNKAKKTVGALLIGFSLAFFVLTVIPNFAITNFALGTFGVVWYALLAVCFLFGLAGVMNLKYVYSAKFTVEFVFACFALTALLHTIFATQLLSTTYAGFENYQNYLAACYSLADGITVGGAFMGIFVYFVRATFGVVGAYAIFVMMLAIFVGIVLDKLIYRKAKKNVSSQTQTKIMPNSNVLHQEDSLVQDEPLQKEPETFEPIDQTIEEEPLSSTEIAKRTIFQNFDEEKYINPNAESRVSSRESAREQLFGHREVPNVALENDKQRDEWMRNYREEHPEEQVQQDENNDDISDIFGTSNFEPMSENQMQSYREDFSRNRAQNLRRAELDEEIPLANFEDDSIDDQIQPISGRGVSSESLSRRTSARDIVGANIDEPKLGSDLQDNAINRPLDLNKVERPQARPQPAQPQPIRQDKQTAMREVRYNSIPISNFVEYAETHEDHTEEYQRKSAALEQVMSDFGIEAKVINVVRGPKVTRYEMSLPAGVSTTKVTSIQNNIAMALMSKAPIRIEAPIPGKNAIGVELENDKASTVGMRELLESPEFAKFKDPLPIAIGKDINGAVVIKSLPKMVHMLVAGSTGSGKSIFIHAVMMSILFKYSPEDVRFIMIDPKRVEFSMYNKLPHLILPEVLCEHDKALNALKWAVAEMERRFALLQENEVQNIEQYNKLEMVAKRRVAKMPYLVVVVDELAELMGNKQLGKDFEHNIQRITQLGRACGIHMVVATQRPSVDVITGTIKNNFPSRVSFKVKSFIDSKTILDEPGAENLLGAGDMLFAPQDSNAVIRLQAAYCNNDEIRNAIKFVKENNIATYDEEIESQIYKKDEPANEGGGEDGVDSGSAHGNGMDELMKQAVDFARANGKISSSVLQRRFRIGYNRAASIVDQMVEFGWAGPSIGSKPREFNISDEQYNELFGSDEDNDTL